MKIKTKDLAPKITALRILLIAMLMCVFLNNDASAQMPLKLGQSVVTSHSFDGVNNQYYPVVEIFDIRHNPPFVPGFWNAPVQYSHSDWTSNRMGEVYGIALDNSSPPNIFIASTDIFGANSSNNGLIFKIDAMTGAVSDYITKYPFPVAPSSVLNTSTIPNTGCGLGNICFDNVNQQLFATNFEDGVIYRIKNGLVKSYYDPFNSDDGHGGYAPYGQRIWGIGIYGNKIYFSLWQCDEVNNNSGYNKIYSVNLNSSGDFINAPPDLVYEFTSFSNPVADIEFSFSGDMLAGERSMHGTSLWAHNSRTLEFPRVSGGYSSFKIFPIGQNNNSKNSCGGVDFGYGKYDSLTHQNSNCDSIVASTGDLLFPTGTGVVYGFQLIKRSAPYSIITQVSQYVDINGDLNGADKTTPGDIDIYRTNICNGSRCDQLVVNPVGISNTNGNCCWQLDLSHPADMSGIRKIQFLPFGSTTFTSFNLISPYNTWARYSDTPTNVKVGPATGNVPGGALNHFAEFCFSHSLTGNEKLIVKWLSNSDSVICADTISLYCEVPCMNVTADSVKCISDNSYSVKFNFTNKSNFTMKTLEFTPLNPSTATIAPSSLTLSPTVSQNGSASNIGFTLSNVTAPSQVCILVKAISSDNCCWCYDTLCVDIPVCICENVHSQVIQTSSGNECCYTINLTNNYSANYFTGIQTEIISSGVAFQYESAGTGWYFLQNSVSNNTWVPAPGSGGAASYIPLGNINNKINFCLYGYQPSQKVVLRWMTGLNRDTVACIDTLTLNCTAAGGPCSEIIDANVTCVSGGAFNLKFKIKNNSSFNATGFSLDKLSPTSAAFTPLNFPTVPINTNSTSAQQSLNIIGVNSGQVVCFRISLYRHVVINNIYYSECCHSDTICIVMPPCPPPCDTTCKTNSIKINTGYNHSNNTLYTNADYDPYWEVIQSPITGLGLPRPAGVVNPTFPVWSTMAGSKWLSVYSGAPVLNGGNYIYQTCFCICGDSSNVNFNFSVMADESAEIWLDGAKVTTGAIGYTSITNVNFTRKLGAGEHCLQVRTFNFRYATGINVSGNITGNNLEKRLCCNNGSAIMGMKFNDLNGNGIKDAGENGIAGWHIKLNNGQTAVTDAFGNYVFQGLGPGTYVVSEVNVAWWTRTKPSGAGTYTVTVTTPKVTSNLDFGNRSLLIIDYDGQGGTIARPVIDFRRNAYPYDVIATANCFKDSLGHYSVELVDSIPAGSYYIAVRSQNTLETWSANPVYFNGTSLNYNFTTSASKAYGNNMILVGNKWRFYSGDMNQDQIIDASDLVMIDNDVYNFVMGDVVTDLNGDGIVDLSDMIIADNNVLNFVMTIRP